MSELEHNKNGATHLGHIAARAIKLYSRPSVAMEIVRLTEQPQVDADALKKCIEQDPALTCKILRVVNSSLFGLKSKVADLDQALSLLGIKPLKLLVLGFSLPDDLFAEVAARELRWYWTNTLTRAVAARLLAEQLWQQPGDEAFIAGLLEGLGTLVMLRELGQPYAKFLSGAIDENCDLSALEQSTLGFDHRQLSAMLLVRWQLPQKLIDAISAPRQTVYLARLPSPGGDLAQVLHLAKLLCQLFGQQRLRVLPDLLDAGKAYRGLTMAQLTEIVRQLQPQVEQLANALSLELDDGRDYEGILREAHEQMGVLSEEVVSQTGGLEPDEDAYNRLREQTDDLSNAMQSFLTKEVDSGANVAQIRRDQGAPISQRVDKNLAAARSSTSQFQTNASLLKKLAAAASRCRQIRRELSLVLFDARVPNASIGCDDEEIRRQLRRTLDQACRSFDRENVSLVALSAGRAAVVLSDCDRSAALATAHHAVRSPGASDGAAAGAVVKHEIIFSAGVATASVVSRNFEPARLIESAERCLNAARACGISAVKSIEV